MRSTLVLVALLALGACQQATQGAQNTQQSSAATEDVIAGRQWTARDGQLQGNSFTLQPGSLAFAQNPRAPVTGEELYSGEMVINTQNAGVVTVRISNGCGTVENDQSFVDYAVQPGENTLRVFHKFARPARCARLSLSTRQPITFQLSSSHLIKR